MTLKLGMVGLDTSHCGEFVKLLNDSSNQFYIPGAKIVKAFPGGSNSFSKSKNRVGQFTEDLRAKNIEIVARIEDLKGLDGFLLESVDGNQHLEQFKILAKYRKPIFIDKPFACTFSDAKKIANLASSKKIPIMTASSLRF